MKPPIDTKHLPIVQTALRVVVGLAFFSHGASKTFGWFGADGTAELMTRFGAAGVIETVAGLLLIVGLFTHWAAFIASGEMAVAYFWIHLGSNDSVWWWQNRGELVMIFCFVWLLFAVWGAGPWSIDAWRARNSGGGSTTSP